MYSCYKPGFLPVKNNVLYRGNQIGDDRNGLLLPLLFGAAIGFPFGYIASNSNKNYPVYQQPYYPPYQPYPQQPYSYGPIPY